MLRALSLGWLFAMSLPSQQAPRQEPLRWLATEPLWRGDELLRSTRRRRTNDVETELRRTLEECRGESLRLVIADDSTAPWGFVSVRGLAVIE